FHRSATVLPVQRPSPAAAARRHLQRLYGLVQSIPHLPRAFHHPPHRSPPTTHSRHLRRHACPRPGDARPLHRLLQRPALRRFGPSSASPAPSTVLLPISPPAMQR